MCRKGTLFLCGLFTLQLCLLQSVVESRALPRENRTTPAPNEDETESGQKLGETSRPPNNGGSSEAISINRNIFGDNAKELGNTMEISIIEDRHFDISIKMSPYSAEITDVEMHIIKEYANSSLPGKAMSKLLDKVFKNYDKRIRPFYEVKRLDVKIDMHILSFGELSETNMLFTVDMYLAQFWQDPRLAFGLNQTLILSGSAIDKLWIPDTFIINSISTKIHRLVATNQKIWISLNNGTMMLVTRLKSTSSCKVNLRDYPLDEQTCHLTFESFSFEEKDLKYEWRKKIGSDIFIYDDEMAQFDIISAKRFGKHDVYHSSMFSGLTTTVKFQRRSVYFIFQMYIPCICVVILSWVSFWIDEREGSDRVGLGIATVLTISFMRGSMNDNMPKVSYLKSIDYFLLGSFAFVFMTLIEYVLLVKQKRKEKNEKKKKQQKNPFSQVPILPDVQEQPGNSPVSVCVVLSNGKSYNLSSPVQTVVNCIEKNNKVKTWTEKTRGINRTTKKRSPTKGNPKRSLQRRNSVAQFVRKALEDQEGVHYMDKYSRILFPVSYGIFLGIYFGIYTIRL